MKKNIVGQSIFFLLFSFVAPLSIINHAWGVNAANPLTSPTTSPTTPSPTLPLTPPLTPPAVTPTKTPICKSGVNSFAVSGYCRRGLVSSVKFTCYDGYTKSIKGFCAPVSYWQNLANITCINHRVCR